MFSLPVVAQHELATAMSCRRVDVPALRFLPLGCSKWAWRTNSIVASAWSVRPFASVQ